MTLKPFITPKALTAETIKDIIADYAHAAKCALQSGFMTVLPTGIHTTQALTKTHTSNFY